MIYADTSILVSTIVRDENHGRALRLLETASKPMVFNRMLRLEVGNAIRLCVSDRRMTERDASKAELVIEELISSGRWVLLEPDWERAFERAKGLSLAHTKTTKSRSLDILHVACAMDLGLRDFWSFDDRQRKLAGLAGLRVNT